MQISKLTTILEFPVKPGEWDAIWVLLADRKEGRPLESAVLRDLDWRLQGLLSRYVLTPPEANSPLTYVPIEARSGIRFLVLDNFKSLSKKSLDSVCRGINAKRVLVWPETAELSKWLEKQWSQVKDGKGDVEELVWGDDSVPVASGAEAPADR